MFVDYQRHRSVWLLAKEVDDEVNSVVKMYVVGCQTRLGDAFSRAEHQNQLKL